MSLCRCVCMCVYVYVWLLKEIKKILFSNLIYFPVIEFSIFDHIRVPACVSRISRSSLVLPVFGLHDLSSVSESLWYTCSWKGTDADDDYQWSSMIGLFSEHGLMLPHHLVSFNGGHGAPPRRGFIVTFRVLCVSPTPQLRLHALHGPHSPTLQSLGAPRITNTIIPLERMSKSMSNLATCREILGIDNRDFRNWWPQRKSRKFSGFKFCSNNSLME